MCVCVCDVIVGCVCVYMCACVCVCVCVQLLVLYRTHTGITCAEDLFVSLRTCAYVCVRDCVYLGGGGRERMGGVLMSSARGQCFVPRELSFHRNLPYYYITYLSSQINLEMLSITNQSVTFSQYSVVRLQFFVLSQPL